MPPTLQHVLLEKRRVMGLTQSELARRSGLSRGTIRDIESGSRPSVGTATLNKLASVLGVDAIELLGAAHQAAKRAEQRVAVVGRVVQGEDGRVIVSPPGDNLEWVEKPPEQEHQHYRAIRVATGALEPAYKDGDVLFLLDCTHDPACCLGRDVLCQLPDGTQTLARLESSRAPAKYTICQLGQSSKRDTELLCCYKVAWISRK